MRFEAADKQPDFSLEKSETSVLSLAQGLLYRLWIAQLRGGEREQKSSPCPTHQVQGLSPGTGLICWGGGALSHPPKAPTAGGGPALSKEMPAYNL